MPAPGGKGTELAARLRHSGASGPVNAASRIKGETLPCRGGVGQALAAQGGELFSADPSIQNIDVLAYKLPGENG